MTQTSQQFSVPQGKTTQLIHLHTHLQSATILRTAAALVFVCALGLAPAPAFAQHGGGGGGGGAHGGGGGFGGGGGAHGGGFGSGGSAPASSGGASAANNSGGSSNHSNSSSGGHSWNPFHSGSKTSAAPANGANGQPLKTASDSLAALYTFRG